MKISAKIIKTYKVTLHRLVMLSGVLLLFNYITLKAQTPSSHQGSLDSLDRYQRLIDSSFVYGNQGKYDLAEVYLRRAISERPTNPLNILLLNNLGGIQELQSKTREALLSYSAALEKSPSEQIIRANRARLFVTMGNLKGAITDYSILVSQEPTNEVYKYQRAMTYILDKQYDLAEVDLEAIVRDNEKSLKARIGIAMLQTIRGQYDEAERLYSYLLERLPNSAEVYEGRARLFLAKGMRGYALRDLQKALELSGTNPTASLIKLREQIHTGIGEGNQKK